MTKYEALSLITDIAYRGPNPAMYGNVHQAFKTLHRTGLCREHGVFNILVAPSRKKGSFNIIEKIFSQPYGYAGDFNLLATFYRAFDSLYTDYRKCADGCSLETPSRWDDYILSLPTSQSVYNRERYLLEKISKLVDRHKVHSILDIACGNGRLLKEIQSRYPGIRCVGIDAEPAAIQAAKQGHYGARFEVMNAVQRLPLEKFDLVISAGLFDYLSDAHAERLMRRIVTRLEPLYVIIGNMTQHDWRAEMELLRWKLIYREGIDLVSLASGAFQEYAMDVEKEDQGINLFLTAALKEHLWS